ncbi:HAD family hydrolase [Geomesophilobacter sediminis]|uniref:HAD family hydrolase n=1 Tax=Geomesophilobacter sediminis TaxID=2798584 RepID=A0A8J7SB35_9BACT|nr:HAD family hydrolase [Geomesophilobacter sediminis]MBJ6727596.1 HAD family hydrolase [Geomesophilobacter sediminis]
MHSPHLPLDILRSSHWVFDLDGTLTVAIHDFAQIRQELGIPEGDDILVHLAGLPSSEALRKQERLLEIELELAGRTEPAPGAVDLVTALSRRGAHMGVLTRNTRGNALRTLERIGVLPYLDHADVLGRDEARAKPDPDGILQLAAKWGTHPERVVMVGDYRFDLETGRAAGAATVHVDTTRSFRWPELTDLAVGSLAELGGALLETGAGIRRAVPVRRRRSG